MWALPGSVLVTCGMEMASTMLLARAVCRAVLHDSGTVDLSSGLTVSSVGSGCTVGRGAGIAGSDGVTAAGTATATGDSSSDLLPPVSKINIFIKSCKKKLFLIVLHKTEGLFGNLQ